LAAAATPAILRRMASPASALDVDALARARALLEPPARTERVWPALAAAILLAVSALGFATAMLMAPPLTSEHVGHARSVD
jgi:hypothetical protein